VKLQIKALASGSERSGEVTEGNNQGMQRKLLMILALVSGLSIMVPAQAAETRCGWLKNPTPANWWLQDRDANWTISLQGGYQARGMDNLPDMDRKEYVLTNANRSYGYGCACLRVTTNGNLSRITSIQSAEQLPLKTCRQDPDLPRIP
jgi:hypothetical protein